MQPVSFSEKEHRPEIHGSWRIIPLCALGDSVRVVTFTKRTYGDIMGIMSTPDKLKPWLKIRGYSPNSHNLILKWYPPN